MADKNAKALEELRRESANKQCMDCHEKGTTYAVMNFGIFVCSKCAGIHRELTHKVKGLGMCVFTDDEIEFLRKWGNEVGASIIKAKKVWLAEHKKSLYPMPNPKDPFKLKEFMRVTYQQKRFYKGESSASESEEESDSEEEQKKKVKKPRKKKPKPSLPQDTKIANEKKPKKPAPVKPPLSKATTNPPEIKHIAKPVQQSVPPAQSNVGNLFDFDVEVQEEKPPEKKEWERFSLPSNPPQKAGWANFPETSSGGNAHHTHHESNPFESSANPRPQPQPQNTNLLTNLNKLYQSSTPNYSALNQNFEAHRAVDDPFSQINKDTTQQKKFSQPMYMNNPQQLQMSIMQNIMQFCQQHNITTLQYLTIIQNLANSGAFSGQNQTATMNNFSSMSTASNNTGFSQPNTMMPTNQSGFSQPMHQPQSTQLQPQSVQPQSEQLFSELIRPQPKSQPKKDSNNPFDSLF